MLSLERGRIIGRIKGGELNNKLVSIVEKEEENCCDEHDEIVCLRAECCSKCGLKEVIGKEIELKSKFEIYPNTKERGVYYIAGPSGSGKTSYAVEIIKKLKKMRPESDFYIFSRTNASDDPAFKGMKGDRIILDERIVTKPINIEEDIPKGSIILFDDCGTIQNDSIKKGVEKIMSDVMEVGRKMGLDVIITNHLVVPNEKKMARTIMNEMHALTVFPKSGSAQQISYVLKTYFGLNKKQIEKILSLKSRWVTITKTYPHVVMYEHGAFIL